MWVLAGDSRSRANEEVKSKLLMNDCPTTGKLAQSNQYIGSEAPSERGSFTKFSNVPSEASSTTNCSSDSSGAVPLCPLLVVPVNTRLACVVQNLCHNRQQDLTFDVRGLLSRGGLPLFQIRVAEVGAPVPGIHLETLNDRVQLAFLSTAELWLGGDRPRMNFFRASGVPFGSFQKAENGWYRVMYADEEILWFTGSFSEHQIQVIDRDGVTVATVSQQTSSEYRVYVQARTDAGLVILGLLAIDKCEQAACQPGISH